jgi:hypothetical protein
MRDNAARIENYRRRAEEVRIIAESLKDADARVLLLKVSEDYLRMAATLSRMAGHPLDDNPQP